MKKNKIAVAEIYFEKASTLYESLNFLDAIELINIQKGIIKKEKKEVVFVPTDEDIAKELYNEKIESKKLSTPTHTYKITGADRYNRNK